MDSCLLRRIVPPSILFALFLTGAAQAADAGLWLGMLREDDIIAPIAFLKDGEWSRPWPDDPAAAQVTADAEGKYAGALPLARIPAGWLAGQPAPARWTLISGRHALHPIGVDRAVEYETECGYLWGLTDRAPRDPELEREAWPIEKMGFVISAPVTTLRFTEVENDARDARAVLGALTPDLRFMEAAAIDGAKDLSAVPRTLEARDRSALRLLHAYRVAQPSGGTLWYLEAQKEYPKPPTAADGACATAVVMQVWAEVRDGRVTLARGDTVVTDCDMKEFHSLRPVAEIAVARDSYMLALGHGDAVESYDIFRWSPRDVRLLASYTGGGC